MYYNIILSIVRTKLKGLKQSLYITKKLKMVNLTKTNLNLGKCVNGDKTILLVTC